MVVEVVENKSCRRLSNDARKKVFSHLSSIQVFVEVKLFKKKCFAPYGPNEEPSAMECTYNNKLANSTCTSFPMSHLEFRRLEINSDMCYV